MDKNDNTINITKTSSEPKKEHKEGLTEATTGGACGCNHGQPQKTATDNKWV